MDMTEQPYGEQLSDFGRGWDAATRDINSGIAQPGDVGFQPPTDDYQRGYNARIDAPQGPGVVGIAIILALGLAIIGFLWFVLKWTQMPN